MNLLSERLSWAMNQKALRTGEEVKPADIARAANSANAAANFWLNDINGISSAKARLIAEFLGVDPTWLETGKGKPTLEVTSRYIQDVIKMMEASDDRGQEKIFIAARDAYELHQAHKMRLDAEIQRVSEVNKAMSNDAPAGYASASLPPVVQR